MSIFTKRLLCLLSFCPADCIRPLIDVWQQIPTRGAFDAHWKTKSIYFLQASFVNDMEERDYSEKIQFIVMQPHKIELIQNHGFGLDTSYFTAEEGNALYFAMCILLKAAGKNNSIAIIGLATACLVNP